MSSTSQTPDKSGDRNGGRDKDRTCDPYDVNTVAAPEQPGFVASPDALVNAETHTIDAFLGNSLGEKGGFENAVAWLTENLDNCPRPIIPYIKQTYDLGNVDAVEAIRLARLKRGMEAE